MNKGLICYITAGVPSLAKTKEFIEALAEHCDFVAAGIPFSDPVADPPAVEAAHLRAIESGVTTSRIFDTLQGVKMPPHCKLIVQTYANPAFAYGYSRFAAKCRECGVFGLIIPDMPREELGELAAHTDKHGIRIIPIVAPTSDGRIKTLTAAANKAGGSGGFVYYMSPPDLQGLADDTAKIKAVTPAPVYVSAVGAPLTPALAKAARKSADGIIITAELAAIIQKHGAKSTPYLVDFVKPLAIDVF